MRRTHHAAPRVGQQHRQTVGHADRTHHARRGADTGIGHDQGRFTRPCWQRQFDRFHPVYLAHVNGRETQRSLQTRAVSVHGGTFVVAGTAKVQAVKRWFGNTAGTGCEHRLDVWRSRPLRHPPVRVQGHWAHACPLHCCTPVAPRGSERPGNSATTLMLRCQDRPKAGRAETPRVAYRHRTPPWCAASRRSRSQNACH